ncbi:MAG TPA: NAD(P)-dependent oxidoreductase [Solirubrobacteraceae bacterium]|jgi:UDP-glucose 4-epimerase
MQLITGGLGFIGSHTARALLDLDEDCVVTQHNATQVPDFLQPDVGARLLIEPLDVENASALLALGNRHKITGIVHLADPATHRLWNHAGSGSPERLDGLFDSLFHVLHAAREWGATRVTIASTIGVYGGLAPGRWSEDTALPMLASHPIPTAKKCTGLLAALLGDQIGIATVQVRPSAIWGPGGRAQSSFFALPALVHAAIHGDTQSPSISQPLYADDATDACYVKDCARGIALIQTAPDAHPPHLQHRLRAHDQQRTDRRRDQAHAPPTRRSSSPTAAIPTAPRSTRSSISPRSTTTPVTSPPTT